MTIRLGDIAGPAATALWEDTLESVMKVMAGEKGEGSYRVIVTSEAGVVRGIVTGRVVLEILMGWRGPRGGDVRSLLNEPVHIFADEALHILPHWLRLRAALTYMLENRVGCLIVVDDLSRFMGVVDEKSLLKLLKGVHVGVKVEDAMERDLYVIRPDSRVMDAVATMVQAMRRRLPVVSDGGRIEGIVTATDILREVCKGLASGRNPMNEPVSRIMERNVIYVKASEDLSAAVEKLVEKDVSSVLVASEDGGSLKLEGIVTRLDALMTITHTFGPEETVNVLMKRARYLKHKERRGGS